MDVSTGSSARTDRYKEAIKAIILSSIPKPQFRELRKQYFTGNITLADLSRSSDVPPVLLWSSMTHLYEKTQLKYTMLRREARIFEFWRAGKSFAEIADALCITETEAANYTVDRFTPGMFFVRPWYDRKHPVPVAAVPVDILAEFSEATLPPTSRLGWKQGELLAPDPDTLGRCPTCGCIVVLPCLACRTREYLKTHRVPQARQIRPEEDVEEALPSLMFR